MELKTDFVRYEKNITEDGYKLICIPYAGGGASTFAGWQNVIGDSVEILPVQLPGRENRVMEPLLNDFQAAADAVHDAFAPYIKAGRFSIFGHSMGGIIGFELAKRFEAEGCGPERCFISATSLVEKDELIRSKDLSDDEFFQRVADYGGIDASSEILQYPEFREIFMKILRADFNLIESYRPTGGKLRCPVTAFCGTEDPMERAEDMKTWKEYTEGEMDLHLFEGGHFYFMEDPAPLCTKIAGYIGR